MRKLISTLLLALVALAAWLAWALFLPVAPEAQKFILLRPGYSTRRIARELKSAGVIRSADAFVLWHALHRRPSLKAGEYLFERDANVIGIHSRLARGDVYYHTVVIPEGFNMFDIAKAIEDAGLGSAEDFLKVATTDTALIADLAPTPRRSKVIFSPTPTISLAPRACMTWPRRWSRNSACGPTNSA